MKLNAITSFLRDGSLAAIASYLGLSLYSGFTSDRWALAWSIFSERTEKRAAIITILISLLTGIILGALSWKFIDQPKSRSILRIIIIVFIATIIANLFAEILASPFAKNACFDIDRRTAAMGWFTILQPLVILSGLIVSRWGEQEMNIIKQIWTYFRPE